MTTRNGKVARLPFEIREELNHRLLENEPVRNILIWLSTDSTVIAVLERLFEGRPITEQNISEWRQGGFQEWLTYRSCLDNVRDLAEDAARVALTGVSAEHLLLALTATYAGLLKKWGEMPEIAFNRKLIVLQDLTKIALAMRRSEQKDARLQIDRERLEILREKYRNKSPSSFSSRASSFSSARPSSAHPFHPKAPEIRRPPIPRADDEWSDEEDRPSSAEAFHPNACGPSPRIPASAPPVAAAPTGPAPTPASSREPVAPQVSPSRPPDGTNGGRRLSGESRGRETVHPSTQKQCE